MSELTGTPPDGSPVPAPGDAPAPTENTADSTAAAPMPLLPLAPSPKRYTARVAIAYVCLGLALAAAITAFVVLVFRPGHKAGLPWSSWKPTTSSQTDGTKQIADHVGGEYRLSAGGRQLVAVVPSAATVTSGTTNIAVKAIAVEKVPQSSNGMSVIYNPKMQVYQLCGLGQNCSISTGTATKTRGRLVRREALELALYTFKFIPSIDSVAAFMPPPPGQAATEVVFFQKSELKDQLDRPLAQTLSSSPAPLPSDPDTSEVATIDSTTLPYLYTYQLQALQTGGAALILAPAVT
jgi:hypothetical protein